MKREDSLDTGAGAKHGVLAVSFLLRLGKSSLVSPQNGEFSGNLQKRSLNS